MADTWLRTDEADDVAGSVRHAVRSRDLITEDAGLEVGRPRASFGAAGENSDSLHFRPDEPPRVDGKMYTGIVFARAVMPREAQSSSSRAQIGASSAAASFCRVLRDP